MNLLVASLLVASLSSSMQIDPVAIENFSVSNPNDTKSRMLLARHYYDLNQYTKAQQYLDEVLSIDTSMEAAKQLKNQISAINSSKDILSDLNIIKPYTSEKLGDAVVSLHQKQKYLEQVSIYQLAQTSNIRLADKPLLVTARYFGWDGQHKNAEKALKQIDQKKSVDYLEEYAKLCEVIEQFDCAIKSYKTLYRATQSQKYGMKLFKLYWKMGRYQEAEKLFAELRNKNPKQKDLQKFDEEIKAMREKRLAALKKAYDDEPDLEKFLAYISGLSEVDQVDKAILLIEEYLIAKPNDTKVHFELATRLSWLGRNDRAIEVLSALLPSDDKSIALKLGEIHAWSGHFEQSIAHLDPLTDDPNKQIAGQASRTLAYTYLWNGVKDKARFYFNKALHISPQDIVASEELMILDGNVKPLLKKYHALHKQNKTNVDTIQRLANFYQLLGDKKNARIYLEKLNKIQPGNLSTQKALGEVLVGDKQHYRGFGLLEKYAYQKNTSEALFELAQQYYWAGFNDEAKDVLTDLLRQYPDDKKAYALKAEILKSNPRFVSDKNSQSGWQKYENDKSKKQVELADRLYFAEFYKSSIPYYEEHLKIAPEDYDARYRYAFALQHSKLHREAAGEFYLMFWQKKDIELRYHYAYNLEMMGKTKQAYQEYLQVLENQPKPVPNYLNDFLAAWQLAWQSQDLNNYSQYYSKRLSNDSSWRIRKELSFKNSSFIAVSIKDPLIIKQQDGLYTIKFFQEFASKRVKDSGYKTLQISCQSSPCFITKERWTAGEYKPNTAGVYSFVEERIEALRPQVFQLASSKPVNDRVDQTNNQQPLAPSIKNPAVELPVEDVLYYSNALPTEMIQNPRIDFDKKKPNATENSPVEATLVDNSSLVATTSLSKPSTSSVNNGKLQPVTSQPTIVNSNTPIVADPRLVQLEEKIRQLETMVANAAKASQQTQEIQAVEVKQKIVNREENLAKMMAEFEVMQKQENSQKKNYQANNASSGQATVTNVQPRQTNQYPPIASPVNNPSAYGGNVIPQSQQMMPQSQPQQLIPPPQIMVPVQQVVIVGYDIYRQPIYATQQTYKTVPNPAYQQYYMQNMQQPQMNYQQTPVMPYQTVPQNIAPQYGQPQYSSPQPLNSNTGPSQPPVTNNSLQSDQQKPTKSARREQKKKEPIIALSNLNKTHELSLELFQHRDVNGLEFDRQRLGYRYQLNKDYELGLSAANFDLRDQNGSDHGYIFQAELNHENFTVGGKLEKMQDYELVSPYAAFRTSLGEHSLSVRLDQSALPLTKYSICSGDDKLHATNLTVSDYTDWSDGANFWGAIEVAKINDDDANTVITPQFDYRFDYRQWDKLSTHLIGSGWYQANKKQTDCYYSPDFVDANYLGINAAYELNDSWLLKGNTSLGYSFSSDKVLYKYGIWLEKQLLDSAGVEVGCYESQSTGGDSALGAYGYRQCRANFRYQF